MRRFSFTHFSG